MYHRALAPSAATFIGYYRWFATYNFHNAKLPQYEIAYQKFLRQTGIGFTATVISDSISNSLRVIKTTKQTYYRLITYPEVTREILNKDGIQGLMGRGLQTRIMCNGV